MIGGGHVNCVFIYMKEKKRENGAFQLVTARVQNGERFYV